MGKQLKIGEAASYLGIAKTTLRTYANEGKINCHTLPSGHRFFDEDDLLVFMQKEKGSTSTPKGKVAFLYARVSTRKQMEAGNLSRQVNRLVEYALQQGYTIGGLYQEVASGVNENRKELKKCLETIKETKQAVLLVEYKDRLARFGYRYIEQDLQAYGIEICLIDETEKNDEEELVEDLIAIVTSFSARIYGKRGGKKVTNHMKSVLKNNPKNGKEEKDDD